jgi:(p)ppGpp synthase/HD superfamily hydrolase
MNDAVLNAIEIAAEAHDGQVDGGGYSYIRHPLTVLRMVAKELPDDADAQAAAVLHDVLEDVSFMYPGGLMRRGVSLRAVELVKAVTRGKEETYEEFIDRVASAGPVAITIKLADLGHNLSRMHCLPLDKRAKLEPRYLSAWEKLTAALGLHNGD